MNLEWNVFYHDINRDKITTLNILKQHGSFNEYIKKAFKKCKTKDEFAEVLRRELMYYFWSKCEWELIIEITEDNCIILSPWCGRRNPEETKIDVTDDTSFDWKGFAEKHIKKQIYKNRAKIDVYDQVDYMWDDFLDYVWNSKKRRKKNVVDDEEN
jgi:hypothetical protein